MKKKHTPFTLIELLATIAIIAVLAGIVMAGLSFASRRSIEAQTIARMEQFQIALEEYKKDYGVYPIQTTAGNIDFNSAAWDVFVNWDRAGEKEGNSKNKKKKPYMEGIFHDTANTTNLFLDGNGEPFQYQYPNTVSSRNTTKYALWSKGADGTDGNEDDICSWKQK